MISNALLVFWWSALFHISYFPNCGNFVLNYIHVFIILFSSLIREIDRDFLMENISFNNKNVVLTIPNEIPHHCCPVNPSTSICRSWANHLHLRSIFRHAKQAKQCPFARLFLLSNERKMNLAYSALRWKISPTASSKYTSAWCRRGSIQPHW